MDREGSNIQGYAGFYSSHYVEDISDGPTIFSADILCENNYAAYKFPIDCTERSIPSIIIVALEAPYPIFKSGIAPFLK